MWSWTFFLFLFCEIDCTNKARFVNMSTIYTKHLVVYHLDLQGSSMTLFVCNLDLVRRRHTPVLNQWNRSLTADASDSQPIRECFGHTPTNARWFWLGGFQNFGLRYMHCREFFLPICIRNVYDARSVIASSQLNWAYIFGCSYLTYKIMSISQEIPMAYISLLHVFNIELEQALSIESLSIVSKLLTV